MDKTQISEIQMEIQKEYSRIDNKWLELHYRTTIGLVAFAFLVECVLGNFLLHSDQLNTTVPIFIFKFIILPGLINFFCIIADYLVIRSCTITQEKKVFIVSILFVVICFVLFTVHIAFSALYFIFAIPILLTIIYANYRLTVVTALLCMTSEIISELFITWDYDKVSIFASALRFGDFLISLFMLCAFSAVSMVAIRFEREKNAAAIQKELERHQLQQKLQLDELTGIYNRRALQDAIKDMETDESGSSYIFVMIDMDHFKKLNDTLGHPAGDFCLAQMGRILKANCKEAVPFRYGGDEFCILFRNVTMERVKKICRQIQFDLKKTTRDSGIGFSITASFGISPYTKEMDAANLLLNTDQALYSAKSVKNAIRVYSN